VVTAVVFSGTLSVLTGLENVGASLTDETLMVTMAGADVTLFESVTLYWKLARPLKFDAGRKENWPVVGMKSCNVPFTGAPTTL
jgi:hypothetical protein